MSCPHATSESGVSAITIVGVAYGAVSITIASANLFLEYRKFCKANDRGMSHAQRTKAIASAALD